jgi:hypothetical protein
MLPSVHFIYRHFGGPVLLFKGLGGRLILKNRSLQRLVEKVGLGAVAWAEEESSAGLVAVGGGGARGLRTANARDCTGQITVSL